ncbi:MAG: hypothetical protein PHH60_06070 [Candidatus Margulisbacteria bacterium]|nr:hypothetical protein [Candidatus Margulisiibacteriota bacterium]
MNSRPVIVRIVKPSDQPVLPKYDLGPVIQKDRVLLAKFLNILFGSCIGLVAGTSIFLTLRLSGVNFGGLESSIIVGLPSALGIVTSFVIFQ